MNKKPLDERVLGELSKNSRQSFRTLAKTVGASVASVVQHVHKLEKEGIISGYGADLDYTKLGYDLMAVINVTIQKGALLKVQKEIAKMPEVVSVYDITGEADSLVVARVKNRSELSRVAKKILGMENVERTNTHVVLNTIKENYRMQHLEDVAK